MIISHTRNLCKVWECNRDDLLNKRQSVIDNRSEEIVNQRKRKLATYIYDLEDLNTGNTYNGMYLYELEKLGYTLDVIRRHINEIIKTPYLKIFRHLINPDKLPIQSPITKSKRYFTIISPNGEVTNNQDLKSIMKILNMSRTGLINVINKGKIVVGKAAGWEINEIT